MLIRSTLLCLMSLSLTSAYAQLKSESAEQKERIPHKISNQEASVLVKLLKKSTLSSKPQETEKFMFGANGQVVKGDKNGRSLYFGDFCSRDEDEFLKIERQVLNQWSSAWEQKKTKGFFELWSEKGQISSFSPKYQDSKKLGNIDVTHWQLENEMKNLNNEKESIEKYLSSFSKIEEFKLSTTAYLIPKDERSKDLKSTSKMMLKMNYDLRGFQSLLERRQDRGILNVVLVKEKSHWKIQSAVIEKMNTMTNKVPAFAEVTSASGLKDLKKYQRLEAIRRGGYALAIGDYNNDGVSDIYSGAYGPAQLFKGLKNGTYEEVKTSGIKSHRYVKSAIWADFNNDGSEDLMLVRFVPNDERVTGGGRSDIIIYKNTGNNSFVNAGTVEDNTPTGYAMPASVADFNNDGLLDIYVGYPGSKDFTSGPADLAVDKLKEGTKAQGVYLNAGNFNFKTHKMAELDFYNYEKFTTLQKVYPHSAVAVDINNDMAADIMVVDDRDNLSPLYVNNGKGQFTQNAEKIGVSNAGYGMGLAISDFNNDGLVDILASGVTFAAASRVYESCLLNWDSEMRVETAFQRNSKAPMRYFSGMNVDGKMHFSDKSSLIDKNDLGDGLAGMEYIDYNNDGFSDVYVANGLWSGTDKNQEISSLVSRSSSFNGNSSMIREGMNKTQSKVMELLSNFEGDIFSEGKKERPSLGGFQRNKLFRNSGDGSFVEVGFLEGVDSIADGYVIARADVNNDGFSDLILRNGDPGTLKNSFPSVQIYVNQGNVNKSIRLKLVGSSSNKNAIGAVVEVKLNDKFIQTKQLIGNNGTAQSEKILHFGLGEYNSAAEINVKWPSGQKSQ